MNIDTELNSEKSSAAEEAGGQSQVSESSAARPPGSDATTPAAIADAASAEGPIVANTRDEGQSKTVIAQRVEPSVEAERISSVVEAGGESQFGKSSIAIVSSGAAAVGPLEDALAALDRRDYATAQRLFEVSAAMVPPPLSGTPWRR